MEGLVLAESFGNRLKALRTENKMSQQQLAAKLFVSRSSVANWENSRRLPDFIIISRIAQLFRIDISELSDTFSDEKNAPPEIIIVDDEVILLSGAIPILSKVMPSAVITGFSRVSEAVKYAENNNISIAFLDIELGKTSGLELCRTLTGINPMTNVIFLTSYPDYAFKAWETTASGFLMKPLHEEDVKEQLSKLRFPVKWGGKA